MKAWERFLGSDNCETCGTNFNEIILEWLFEEGTWEITVQVGCYGGGQKRGNASDILDYVHLHWIHLLERHDTVELQQVLENAKTQSWQFQIDPAGSPVDATGVLEIQRIDDCWESLLNSQVDDSSEFSSHEGSWSTLRQWIQDEIADNYMSAVQTAEVVSRVESAAS